MNAERDEPLWRWISPHAFANDGLRWHVRAFCHLDQRFKDFLLSRCISADGDEAQKVPGNRDENWHEFFSVILVPNPLLNVNQQKIVAQDYCMDDGKIAISIRRSFLYYFRKRLRLDVAQVLDEVRETPVVVENQEEFEAALIEADR
jgi:predicted DNA-binding transcriptional regulator YafY